MAVIDEGERFINWSCYTIGYRRGLNGSVLIPVSVVFFDSVV